MNTLLNILFFISTFWLCSCKHTPVDLTYAFENTTVNFPGGAPFRWTAKRYGETKDGNWYSSFDFATAEHSGTHMDAPYHFYKEGSTIDNIPLYNFVVTGILVNATLETGTNASYSLPASKLIEWERMNGEIPDHSVVFINFGWGKKFYPDRQLYLGPTDDNLQFPTVSKEAAEWIVNTKRVVGIGVDTPSPDLKNADVHVLLAKNEMYIMENLNITVPLPPKFRVISLPMKLKDGTGGPVRVVAFV